MSVKYVYTMSELSKKFDGGRQVLKDISLSFIPGAKIGVLGLNGSGKSTLLKIMAGLEKEFSGEAWAAEGRHEGAQRSSRGRSVRCLVPGGTGFVFHGP